MQSFCLKCSDVYDLQVKTKNALSAHNFGSSFAIVLAMLIGGDKDLSEAYGKAMMKEIGK